MLGTIVGLCLMWSSSCQSLALRDQGWGQISQKTKDMVLKWAPHVWIHSQEQFFPSSIDFYLDQMEVRRDGTEEVVVEHPSASNLGQAPTNATGLHLNTHQDMNCVNCFQEVFYGQENMSEASLTFFFKHFSL